MEDYNIILQPLRKKEEKKMNDELYQQMTAKEIIKDLNTFIEFYQKNQNRTPLCMVAAIEYINLHEERKINGKKKKNNINQIR